MSDDKIIKVIDNVHFSDCDPNDPTWGRVTIQTAGAVFTLERNGDVIFNGRKITTDSEIVAALRLLANLVLRCDHKSSTRFGETEWCEHCGAFWIEGQWRTPTGVRR